MIRVGVADWAVGVTVCYDVRFPGLFQALAAPELGNAGKSASGEEPVESATRGAEIFLVPAAFTRKTGEPHWEVLLRARAIETQSYVIAAAQSGAHNERRTSYGHTMIIDPWGTIGKEAGSEDGVSMFLICVCSCLQLHTCTTRMKGFATACWTRVFCIRPGTTCPYR